MFSITPTESDYNPARAAKAKAKDQSVHIKAKHCEAKVAQRVKFYDTECTGFYVSVTPKGVATFNFRYTDRNTGKQRTVWIGVYEATDFPVEAGRTEAYLLKARVGRGENVAQAVRLEKKTVAQQSKTVDDLIERRIKWMAQLERKADGEMRPRIESHSNVASHLRRFVSPRLGRKIATEVTRQEVAQLSKDIVDGKLGKASVSNARHMRRALSGLYNWAADPEQDFVPVTCQPCIKLGKLKEYPAERFLSEAEIRTLWHGLDRPDLPWNRQTVLAIRFALVTMLRSRELLGIARTELNKDDGGKPSVDIPARRVKKRRVINQPLSDLAMEIVDEALQLGDHDYLFPGRFEESLNGKAMANALRGTPKSKGICELLGMAPFTPHDLRRTAATMCGELELPDGKISLCLDHQPNKDENGKPLPAVTRKHYNLATRIVLTKKRAVLDPWATELRRIIGEPVQAKAADAGMRLAA
jgi:integrase